AASPVWASAPPAALAVGCTGCPRHHCGRLVLAVATRAVAVMERCDFHPGDHSGWARAVSEPVARWQIFGVPEPRIRKLGYLPPARGRTDSAQSHQRFLGR